jgi:integrase/recombinase XerD
LTAHDYTEERFLEGFEACKDAVRAGLKARFQRGPNKHAIAAAAVFLRFLRDKGLLPQPLRLTPSQKWPLLGDFRDWMSQQRGLATSTLDLYEGVLVELLAVLGEQPQTYTAYDVRRFVFTHAKGRSVSRARTITIAVRAFLRFCAATGRCEGGMEHAIPFFASWRLSSVPKFLEPEALQRLLGSCVTQDAHGRRERAVLLLLARLGLRAGDVAALTLPDIDWQNGRLAVCGKTRRQDWLPLSQEVGDAILAYLEQGRGPLQTLHVFTTLLAPFRPLSRAAVTHLVRGALKRAGIEATTQGAHLLRHSAATDLLRQGVSLEGIGAVLRHRSPQMTAHYAKVDFASLSEIAQPWPGVSR